MSLPNPEAQLVFTAFRAVAGNKVGGNFYQFGVGTGYPMSIAYQCSMSDDIARFRKEVNPEALPGTTGLEDMEFWGFEPELQKHTQDRIVNSGLRPERLRLLVGPVDVSLRKTLIPPKSAAVIYLSLPNKEDVSMAMTAMTPALQRGTVVVVDRWWHAQGQNRSGFKAWLSSYVPLGDFDRYAEPFYDNGWAKAFLIKELSKGID